MLVRSINRMTDPEVAPDPPVPTMKKCPHCVTDVPIKATRCPHCTSELEVVEEPSDTPDAADSRS